MAFKIREDVCDNIMRAIKYILKRQDKKIARWTLEFHGENRHFYITTVELNKDLYFIFKRNSDTYYECYYDDFWIEVDDQCYRIYEKKYQKIITGGEYNE